MGGGKPLQQLRGERLIDRALRQARGWSEFVAVAVRDPSQVQRLEAELIADEPHLFGPLAGLVTGLRHSEMVRRPLLLSIPADTPFLPGDLLDRLCDVIGDANCALASSGGHLHPVCGLWRSSVLDRVPDYISAGRRSLKGFAEMVGYVAVKWPVAPADPFFNVNTVEDLAEAERRAAC